MIPGRTRQLAVSAGLLACIVAFVLGARWAVVSRFGSDLPIWDQWDAEGLNALVPWKAHRLTLAILANPHNEHRVILTKLLNLGLTAANGQWDQRVECVVNPLLPALIAAGLFVLGRRGLARRWEAPLALLLMAGFGLPISWQNIVSGFHSQQFFLIGLSCAAIALLPTAAPWTRRWWIGSACALFALGSMASGLLAAAVALVLVLERRRCGEILWRSAAPTLALCGGLVLAGWLSRTQVAGHEALKAHSASDFVVTVVRALQWPATASRWLGALLWLPWLLLARAVLARKRGSAETPGPARDLGLVLAGLGGWVILQLLATGYARGAGGPEPQSRYLDTLVFGGVVNAMAMAWMLDGRKAGTRGRAALAGLGVAWAAVFGIGVAAQVRESLGIDLPNLHRTLSESEATMRSYLATGDKDYLLHDTIPYPDPQAFLFRIGKASLRESLPASVRPPLALVPSGASSGFGSILVRRGWNAAANFLRDGPEPASPATPALVNRTVWGSFGAAGPAHWESTPIAPGGAGWLQFLVAGSAGNGHASLVLRNAGTGAVVAEVLPRKVPGSSWRTALVAEPREPFVLVAEDDGPPDWIAFAGPVEMGPLSYWAWRTARNGLWIAGASATLAALLAMVAIAGACQAPSRGTSSGTL